MSSFRRKICVYLNAGEARAALEDDFHHFRVIVKHKNKKVLSVTGETLRQPYTACPQATSQLSQLKGMSLSEIATSVTRFTDARQQCTHLLDLAGIAIAQAAQGIEYRCFDIEVPRHIDQRTTATLTRNDGFELKWRVEQFSILGPALYSGVDMRKGMAAWALENLTLQESEAALILRRCALISLGRLRDLDQEVHAAPNSGCYVQQPQRAEQALRVVGSTLDFTDRAHELCLSDDKWLQGHL